MERFMIILLGIVAMYFHGIETSEQCLLPSTLESFCTTEKNNYIRCDGIKNVSILNLVLRSVEGCKTNMEFSNLIVEKLPRGLFNGTAIGSLVFKNFSFTQLTDDEPGPSPFLGLESSLHTLGIIGSRNSIRHWDWNELSQLRSLETLSFGRGNISFLPRNFSFINGSSLSRLQITGSCIDQIESNAMRNFHQLKTLNLDANLLSTISRDTFPVSAQNLKVISLRYNLLDLLEMDTFSNLPGLKNVYLDGNRFNVIQETVFSRIWNQLEYLLFYDNPIRCDCRLSWIIKQKPIYVKEGKPLLCKQPSDLMGSDVQYLRKDILCVEKANYNKMTTEKGGRRWTIR